MKMWQGCSEKLANSILFDLVVTELEPDREEENQNFQESISALLKIVPKEGAR
jgi:hypothetical protein